MNRFSLEDWIAPFLVIYVLIVGLGAALVIIVNFPIETNKVLAFPYGQDGHPQIWPLGTVQSTEQGLLILALLAGIAGSFLHTAQSLSSFLGNSEFRASWTYWYLLRPWIGGVLGLTIYFAFRAGLVAGASTVNPFGVVAVGILGGWFSKTTTDKLQEVFETFFKTDADKDRKDKLNAVRPVVERVEPSPVPAGTTAIEVIGRDYVKGAVVQINGSDVATTFVSATKLRVVLAAATRPGANTDVDVTVKNPNVPDASVPVKLRFQ